MRYAWSDNRAEWKGLDAQTGGEHLEGLYDKFDGHLTKEEILADARNKRSPLNQFFTWDENEAAERWRHKQVALLLSNLRVKREKKATSTRAFVFVSNPDHKGKKVYIDIQSAMRNPEMKRELVDKALTNLKRWITQYGGATELSYVAATVDKLHQKIEAEMLANAGV